MVLTRAEKERKDKRNKAKGIIFFGILFCSLALVFVWQVIAGLLDDLQFRTISVVGDAVITDVLKKPYHNYPGDFQLVIDYHDGMKNSYGTAPCRYCSIRKSTLCCADVGDTVKVRYYDQTQLSSLIVSPGRHYFSDEGVAGKNSFKIGSLILTLFFGSIGLFFIFYARNEIRKNRD